MAVVSYTAKRSLTAGVSVNDTIVLDLSLRDTLTRGRQPVRAVAVAIGGDRESIYDRADVTWQCQTRVLYTTAADAMKMFLDSIEDGQTFSFAPYDGSTDSPIDYRNVQVASEGYSEQREVSTGAGASDGFSYAFQLVEVP